MQNRGYDHTSLYNILRTVEENPRAKGHDWTLSVGKTTCESQSIWTDE